VIYRLYGSNAAVRASRLDCGAALAIGAALFCTSFVPYRFGPGLVATMMASYLLLAHAGQWNLKAAGALLLVLSVHLVWGPILFQLFTPELLYADAALIGGILKWLRPDIVWSGTTFFAPGGNAVSLIGACSSFNNVSSAVLACATIAMLTRTEWARRDIATIVVAGIAMILINATRICLFCWSGSSHLFWHDGAGAQILAIGETLVVLVIAWRGAGPRGRTA
jgi:hypothetical protein